MRKFIEEFQAFINRGNVMDLAVAVIIGGAFNAIVSSMVKDIINPILGFVVGKPDFSNLFVVLRMPEGYTGPETYDALVKAGASVFGYGAFLTAVVNFLLLALVVFFMIKQVSLLQVKLKAQKEEQEKAEPVPAPVPEDVALLREIRDLLKEKAS